MIWDELGIEASDDPKAIRRAYAAQLKKLDPDRDPAGFMRLREALEMALAEAAGTGWAFEPADVADADAFELRATPDIRQPSSSRRAEPSDAPDAADASADPDWLDGAASDGNLLDELESALTGCDASAALELYYRAAATGAMPLHAAPPLLDRLFALVVVDPAIDPTAFRRLARTSGWDQPAADPEPASRQVRERVLARLAAEDWYDALVARAERRDRTPRKQAKLARLMLGRIGKYRMPWVDRPALKAMLDEFRAHETWLQDRIAPAWARKLERRWRRRELAWAVIFALFLGSMLINWFRLFVVEAANGSLSAGMGLATLFAAAFLLWLLKLLFATIRAAIKSPARENGKESGKKTEKETEKKTEKETGPDVPDPPDVPDAPDVPDEQDARLAWLEQQAEAAYDAMYDARAESSVVACYSDAKEFFHDAIALANQLGRTETAERLSKRLAAIKAVYRSQFAR